MDGSEIPALGSHEVPHTADDGCSAWIMGTWYMKAIVDDKRMPVAQRPKKVSPLILREVDEDCLIVSFTLKKKADQCREMEIVMEKMEEPGKYMNSRSNKSMDIEELSMKDHCVLYWKNLRKRSWYNQGKLLGK
ncbi:odorant-binding protein 2b-like [Tamandua tetradactyla]|uniref:odorant-binding protein 2b-like n=1 Tax=Tamandua tetradactyla TaxID=48850 RepID=UPI004053D109